MFHTDHTISISCAIAECRRIPQFFFVRDCETPSLERSSQLSIGTVDLVLNLLVGSLTLLDQTVHPNRNGGDNGRANLAASALHGSLDKSAGNRGDTKNLAGESQVNGSSLYGDSQSFVEEFCEHKRSDWLAYDRSTGRTTASVGHSAEYAGF